MKLVIVESPAKSKTISHYLGKDYQVSASVGHIRDLPKSNRQALDIPAGFVPHYEIIKGKEKVVSDLKNLAAKADEVILATDPDREGEAIAWHIKEAAHLKNPKRIVFHEITKEAVNEALTHPRHIDENLKEAQEARRVLDRLFGYDLSQLVWRKLRYGLSAGRVQSPALRILVEREREIRAFKPEDFWVITGIFATPRQDKFTATCSVEPKTAAAAAEIVARTKNAVWQTKEVTEEEARRQARAPFTTSTLQQAASTRLGYSPSVTMRLAQKLYEAGLITYMRTDSVNLSQQALNEIAQVVSQTYGADYLATKNFKTKSKSAQEAHEAIRPAHAAVTAAGRTAEEKKLYRLIWTRAVSSQMTDAKLLKTKITAGANDPAMPDFTATGSRVVFDGWLKADTAARGEDLELPKVSQGETLVLTELNNEHKQTEPSHRFTEAGLVKELEKRGIGRPSTYAAIIKTLFDRGYVGKEGRSLRPTDTGDAVSGFLEEHFGDYISDSFTAEMEDELDEIALGKRTYLKTLKDFYGPFAKAVKAKKDVEKITNLGAAPADIKCPVCGNPMIIKLSRTGKFYSCARFPDCAGARTIDGKVMEAPKETGEVCPDCGQGKLVEREGRFGKFIACNRYPKCRYVKKTEAQAAADDTGVKCPICGQGTMVAKRGRYGIFYGCSNYPKCNYLMKSKPTGKICGYQRETGPCHYLMMAGTKTIPERCSDKTCPNYNPHKLKKEGKTRSLTL